MAIAVEHLTRTYAGPAGSPFTAVDDFSFAADGGEIIGFGHVWLDPDDELKFFARTHPDARGRGVGSLLVDLCDLGVES